MRIGISGELFRFFQCCLVKHVWRILGDLLAILFSPRFNQEEAEGMTSPSMPITDRGICFRPSVLNGKRRALGQTEAKRRFVPSSTLLEHCCTRPTLHLNGPRHPGKRTLT